MQTDRNQRKVDKLDSMHLSEFQRSYKCQIVTDTKRAMHHTCRLQRTNNVLAKTSISFINI